VDRGAPLARHRGQVADFSRFGARISAPRLSGEHFSRFDPKWLIYYYVLVPTLGWCWTRCVPQVCSRHSPRTETGPWHPGVRPPQSSEFIIAKALALAYLKSAVAAAGSASCMPSERSR
jgi:hypothetical protein